MKKFISLAFYLFLFLSCSKATENNNTDNNTDNSTNNSTENPSSSTKKTYENPVLNESAPDPTAIRANDGLFYLYGTEDTYNMPIYKSNDMVNWTFLGTAFNDQTRPHYKDGSDASLWAPEIRYIKDKYVLFYSLATWGQHWKSTIGYALSDKPEGPFVPKGYVFDSNEVSVENSIDQFYWEEDGKHYMLWGSFFGLYIMELEVSDDLTITYKLGTKTQIAGNAYEGVNVWKRDGYYYLFASRGSCCEGVNSTYQTVVGRSESLFGPYLNKNGEKMLDNKDEIILQGTEDFTFRGPGHNSILLEDDANQTWMLYHAYHNGEGGRTIQLDKVKWKDGWPYVSANNTPSTISVAPEIK